MSVDSLQCEMPLTRCVMLLPRGCNAPPDVMALLRKRGNSVAAVWSTPVAMSEIGLARIDAICTMQKNRTVQAVGTNQKQPIPHNGNGNGMSNGGAAVLLLVEPKRIPDRIALYNSVRRYYPEVPIWEYVANRATPLAQAAFSADSLIPSKIQIAQDTSAHTQIHGSQSTNKGHETVEVKLEADHLRHKQHTGNPESIVTDEELALLLDDEPIDMDHRDDN